MITLAQLLGSLVGLVVAYGMYRFIEIIDEKQREREAQRRAAELEIYKRELRKSVK